MTYTHKHKHAYTTTTTTHPPHSHPTSHPPSPLHEFSHHPLLLPHNTWVGSLAAYNQQAYRACDRKIPLPCRRRGNSDKNNSEILMARSVCVTQCPPPLSPHSTPFLLLPSFLPLIVLIYLSIGLFLCLSVYLSSKQLAISYLKRLK